MSTKQKKIFFKKKLSTTRKCPSDASYECRRKSGNHCPQWPHAFLKSHEWEKDDNICIDDEIVLETRVARFFMLQHTKTGKNVPNNQKIYQMAIKYAKWPKIYQKDIKHLPLQGPPKFTQIWIFGLKYTIWQPCWKLGLGLQKETEI
jgi:hypothetical protein